MKGVIFNIAEKFIAEKYGEDKFDEIMEACNPGNEKLPRRYPLFPDSGINP